MKASKYNYVVPFGEKKIFFNGITEAFFIVSPEYEDAYRRLLETPDAQGEWADTFLIRMRDAGFIVDDDIDELELVRTKLESLRRENVYYLMVLPTYQCNLRCWYCTQEHKHLFMDDKIVENVRRLIVRKLSEDGIEHLHLSWFGGEPLMAYDKVCQLTSFAKSVAVGQGKAFTSSITTNGTLLTPERIETLRQLGITHYQITIDGDRRTHNSIKNLGTISAYDRTLDNINLIAQHTSVSLRFNYSRDNLRPALIFKTLQEKLDANVVGNISFTIFKVWQQNTEEIDRNDVDALFNNGIGAGMYSTLHSTGLCYADWINFDCVFPNGHVGKCDNHSPEEVPGILLPDGTVYWKENMSNYFDYHIFDGHQESCRHCRYLPICWGPCVAKREAMLRNFGYITCKFRDPARDMEFMLSNKCKTMLQRVE